MSAMGVLALGFSRFDELDPAARLNAEQDASSPRDEQVDPQDDNEMEE